MLTTNNQERKNMNVIFSHVEDKQKGLRLDVNGEACREIQPLVLSGESKL